MKKISTVLLVLVLVGSVAFASFTGFAGVEFGVNLDDESYGFTNDTEFSAEVTIFELLVDKAGEGNIYAEISANLTFGFEFDEEAGTIGDGDYDFTGDLDYTAEITSAKIVGDDWYVGILGAMEAPNFASSAIDEDSDEEALDLDPSIYVTEGAGVEVGIFGYTFGISIPKSANQLDGSAYNYFGSVATPDFEFADGLTVAFGAAGLLADTGNAASGSAKMEYATDEYSASLATDLIYSGGFMAEVAIAAAFDPFTVDVYFATDDDSADATATPPITTPYTEVTNILSAQVSATDLEGFDITVAGKDLINSQALSASVAYALTNEVKVGVNGGYTIVSEAWEIGGEVSYTVADYTASADVTYYSTEALEVNASIESTTLVDGATLSLGYENEDIMNFKGAITARAEIAF